MADRPYTLLSCSISLDGYLSGPGPERLLLSNDDDFDRVASVRAGCDAILVGARTIRCDDPRLTVRDPVRVRARRARGTGPTPAKVTVTRHGDIAATSRFFSTGDAEKLVYCSSGGLDHARRRLGRVATVLDGGREVDMRTLAEDLYARGLRRLMVEGGGTVHTQFLEAGLADELQLAVAPFFVGDPRGRRFVDAGAFPWHPGRRATLADVRQVGDVVVMTYALSPRYQEQPAG